MCSPGVALNRSSALSDGRMRRTPLRPSDLGERDHPVACTPASGWEKGQVENQVGLVGERFFTPRLRVKSYDELNAWLLGQCVAYARAHRHPEIPEDDLADVRGGTVEPGALRRALRRVPRGCRASVSKPAWSGSTTTGTPSRRARSCGQSRSARMPEFRTCSAGSCCARCVRHSFGRSWQNLSTCHR